MTLAPPRNDDRVHGLPQRSSAWSTRSRIAIIYDCTCVSGCWSPRDICAERSDASRGKGTRKLADPVTVLPFVAEATQAQATSIPACPEGDRSWSCSLSRRWRGRVLSDWDADDQGR